MLLHGIFPPITTPFYPDGNIYFKKLEHNVERYSKTPVAGLTVLGSTGEAIMLSDEERRQVPKAAREASAPSKVLIAGTGIESAIETLRLTEYAAELGYDVALVRTPHFYKRVMQSTNMLAFYRTVADRSPLPVMIYNVPGFTGYDIPAEVVVELAGHSNIIGMKESGGDVEKIRKMVEATRQVKSTATVTGQRSEWDKNPAEGSRVPDSSGLGAEAGAVAAGWCGRRYPRLCRCGTDRLLRDIRCLEGRRRGVGPVEAGTNYQGHLAGLGGARDSRLEVWNGSERLFWRPGAFAAVAADGRTEGRSGAIAGGCSELNCWDCLAAAPKRAEPPRKRRKPKVL